MKRYKVTVFYDPTKVSPQEVQELYRSADFTVPPSREDLELSSERKDWLTLKVKTYSPDDSKALKLVKIVMDTPGTAIEISQDSSA